MTDDPAGRRTNFIRAIIDDDLRAGKNDGRVATRFPPEPNGYLHIGHAKSICLNFGTARDYGGTCNLRFDDTNPDKESEEYQEAIKADVRWLGFDWGERLYHASDYFQALYDFAVYLIDKGAAYVDNLSAEEIRDFRGTLTQPGHPSPYRDRTVAENRDLFARMRAGEFADGSHVLRAKIAMSSSNINLRDPTIYRIRRTPHHRTGDTWKIYPMYDYTHCISDALEGITHSLCTLEFEDHRPLYDWFLDQLPLPHPQQIEFARLELNYTITSKRKLLALVTEGHVSGWNDPRLPTLQGMRRRGYPPAAIRDFCARVGVTKKETVIDMGVLEKCVRDELDRTAPRAMAVLRPLRVVIENYPDGQVEHLAAANHPKDPGFGSREVAFSRVLYIERDDFMEAPEKNFFRLAPGREVRLRYAYFITCREIVRDPRTGEITELRCTYDPQTRGGNAPDGRKVKGTIHWVAAGFAVRAEIRLYDRLFNVAAPGASVDFRIHLNPASLERIVGAYVEPHLAHARPGEPYQFERLGYFCVDHLDSTVDAPVFNRSVTLRDTWAKVREAGAHE